MLPPGIYRDWEDNAPWQQAAIMAYDQVRQIEDDEREVEYLKAMIPR